MIQLNTRTHWSSTLPTMPLLLTPDITSESQVESKQEEGASKGSIEIKQPLSKQSK